MGWNHVDLESHSVPLWYSIAVFAQHELSHQHKHHQWTETTLQWFPLLSAIGAHSHWLCGWISVFQNVSTPSIFNSFLNCRHTKHSILKTWFWKVSDCSQMPPLPIPSVKPLCSSITAPDLARLVPAGVCSQQTAGSWRAGPAFTGSTWGEYSVTEGMTNSCPYCLESIASQLMCMVSWKTKDLWLLPRDRWKLFSENTYF